MSFVTWQRVLEVGNRELVVFEGSSKRETRARGQDILARTSEFFKADERVRKLCIEQIKKNARCKARTCDLRIAIVGRRHNTYETCALAN
jgi:hypothetical protein